MCERWEKGSQRLHFCLAAGFSKKDFMIHMAHKKDLSGSCQAGLQSFPYTGYSIVLHVVPLCKISGRIICGLRDILQADALQKCLQFFVGEDLIPDKMVIIIEGTVVGDAERNKGLRPLNGEDDTRPSLRAVL